MFKHHRAVVLCALATATLPLIGVACGLDSSSEAQQVSECRSADVGHTTRAAVRSALGDPTTTQHETVAGRRRVVDIWLDGRVGFSFDVATSVLAEKDCQSGELSRSGD